MSAYQLLQNGEQFFPALEREICAAGISVLIETYIFVDDVATAPIIAALKAAAARGVKVRLLIDGIGSKAFVSGGGFNEICAAGIDARVFKRDEKIFNFARTRLRRLHRKVCVIDERVAFVGGINLVSDFAPPNPADAPQFDYAVRIESALVTQIYRNAMDVWRSTHSKYLRRKLGIILRKMPTISESADAAFVYRDNFRNRRSIEKMYRNAFRGAKSEIILANAYFLPGWRLRQELKSAAKRGVKITLLMQGFTDHAFLLAATRALYENFLEQGIYLVEYERSMMHAKVCVVDGQWATVGSSNLDPFSLLLAREANVAIEDAEFAQALRSSLQSAIANESASIAPNLWSQRSRAEKLKSVVAFGLAKIGLNFFGLRSS